MFHISGHNRWHIKTFFEYNFTLHTEPIKLIGEGKYNLNAVKEIQVTESYLGMDEDIRGCQNQLSMENCTTKQYLETLQTQCGCIPFNIKILKKVSQANSLYFIIL